MPTNLPEQAKAKWAEAQTAKSPALRLKLLREFYSMIPKHKGVEKLEVSIKRQIKSLGEEIEKGKRRRPGSSRLEWVVKKEGMLQLGLTGTLQTSTRLFQMLTGLNARNDEVLVRPVVGIFERDSLQFQVVLAPYDRILGEEKQERFFTLLRNVDGIIVALGFEPTTYLHDLLQRLEDHNIDVLSHELAAEITSMPSGGVRVVGASKNCSEREIVNLVRSYRVKNAIVRVSSTATLDEIEAAIYGRLIKHAIFVTLSKNRRDELGELIPVELLKASKNLSRIATSVLNLMNLIRVFTKGVGEERVDRPLLLKQGSRVIDAAGLVHKDLVRFFRYARLWRSENVSPIRVGANFELKDGDTVEIHSA